MPRINNRTIPTPQFQGEGSFIVVKSVSYRVSKQVVRMQIAAANTNDEKVLNETLDFIDRMILESLVGWNWTNDDGSAMPLPKTAEDLDALTFEEIQFITDQIKGLGKPEAKN